MNLIEKWYSLIILFSVMLGLGMGNLKLVEAYAESLIIPLLICMLYITFLQIPVEEIRHSFKNFKFTWISLMINFVWTPLFAWGLALVFLADQPALWIGFIMLMVTPCTDWYIIFTNLAKGNTALSTSILPLNLILQVILLPVYLLLLGGTNSSIEISYVWESMILVLCIPLLLAIFTKFILRKTKAAVEKWTVHISFFPVVLLSLAIAAMFASQGKLLLNHLDLLGKILIPILLFFILNFIIGQIMGSFLRFSYADKASLSLTTLARNSPLALAIAMTAFPNQPLIALTLVIGPLLELPLLAIITQILLFSKRTMNEEGE